MTAETGTTLDDLEAINGVHLDDKTMTVTVSTSDALQKVQELVADVDGKVVNVKVVPVITDADIEKQLERQYGKAIEVPIVPKTAGQQLEQSVLIKLSEQNIDADMQTLRTLLETKIKNGIEGVDIPTDELYEKIFGDGIPDEYWENIQDQINEKLKELDIEPIQIDFKTGNVKKQSEDMKKDWQSAASAISAVGNAMSQIEDPAAKVVGTVAQAIATMALSYSQAALSTAPSGWGWIAFAATGLATMLSSIAAIKDATSGNFANGGVIPGNLFSGDNMRGMTPDGQIFGLNAGEVVLNRAQVSNLASQLNGSGTQYIQLEAIVTGEQIMLASNNRGRRTGRGEIVQSRRVR